MKKVNLNGKLSLKKETIAKLNDQQMSVVNGGKTGGPNFSCPCGLTYGCSATCAGVCN